MLSSPSSSKNLTEKINSFTPAGWSLTALSTEIQFALDQECNLTSTKAEIFHFFLWLTQLCADKENYALEYVKTHVSYYYVGEAGEALRTYKCLFEFFPSFCFGWQFHQLLLPWIIFSMMALSNQYVIKWTSVLCCAGKTQTLEWSTPSQSLKIQCYPWFVRVKGQQVDTDNDCSCL